MPSGPMITRTVTQKDQEKYVADTLIARSELLLRLQQFGNPVSLKTGMGLTATFIKYDRADVVVDRLTEGVTPESTAFSLAEQSVTVDQWGMYITLTDVVELTTKHPILQEALNLEADSVARTKEYNFVETLMGCPNVIYYDGTVANRAAITGTMYWKSEIAHRLRAMMGNAGAPGRQGDMFTVVCDPSVESDVFVDMNPNSYVSALNQQGMDKLEKGIIRDWLGLRWIRSNFMPHFRRLTGFPAPVAGAGGALTGNVSWKVTRKSLSRGFEEEITIASTVAMGGNSRLTFTAPATAGYVYNVYAGSAAGDASLFLVRENLRPGAVWNLDGLLGAGRNPPETPADGVTIHVIFVFGADCVDTVKMDGMSMEGKITPKGPTESDPLSQRRHVGTKYMDKSGIRDASRMARIEVASRFD